MVLNQICGSTRTSRLRRHDLVIINTEGWRAALSERVDLASDPMVRQWVNKGWPLIGRRAMPGETQGVALGLPLPPVAGKRRISLLMREKHVVSTGPPPALDAVDRVAPRAWRPTLERLKELTSCQSIDVRVFGSLAWCALTGLGYLTDRSDLDVLLHVHRDTDLHRLAAVIAEIEASAPMRLDGEFMRDDGAAANWREFSGDSGEILVKTTSGIALLDKKLFLFHETTS